jgi:hypothetical protein
MDARDNIATDLFYKIRSRFTNLKLGKETGEITILPEESRFFDFDYSIKGERLGHVTVSLAEPSSMKVYFSAGIAENMNYDQKQEWYKFLRELRTFAKRRMLSFDTRDIAKDNLDQRDFKFLSSTASKNKVEESRSFGTRRTSYQPLKDTKIIIKHSKRLPVAEELKPGARSRNIQAIFIENHEGERFKYPVKHLAGASAMQRHVANGGIPYDALGQRIVQMSEEMQQLRDFKRYVTRNALVNETTEQVVEQALSYGNDLKNQIRRLSSQKFYENFKESFTGVTDINLSETEVDSLVDMFTVKSFREDIKNVFPIISKLISETNKDQEMKSTSESFDEFEQWVMKLGETEMPAEESGEVDINELAEYISSFYDKESKTFPKGREGVCTMVEKKFGEEAGQLARKLTERLAPDQDDAVNEEKISPEDLKSLERLDIDSAKEKAKSIIDASNTSDKRKAKLMFNIDRTRNVKELLALMWNTVLAGKGDAVVGSGWQKKYSEAVDPHDNKTQDMFGKPDIKTEIKKAKRELIKRLSNPANDSLDWKEEQLRLQLINKFGYNPNGTAAERKIVKLIDQFEEWALGTIKGYLDFKELSGGSFDFDIWTESNNLSELDYQSFSTGDEMKELRDAIDRNIVVSVAFVKKDGTVRHMGVRKSLAAYKHATGDRSEAQRNVESTHNLKKVIDVNAYIKNLKVSRAKGLPEDEAKAQAAKYSWRSINLENVLGFMAQGKFIDLRDENDILNRFGQDVYDALTPSMKNAMAQEQQMSESFVGEAVDPHDKETRDMFGDEPTQPKKSKKSDDDKDIKRIRKLSGMPVKESVEEEKAEFSMPDTHTWARFMLEVYGKDHAEELKQDIKNGDTTFEQHNRWYMDINGEIGLVGQPSVLDYADIKDPVLLKELPNLYQWQQEAAEDEEFWRDPGRAQGVSDSDFI